MQALRVTAIAVIVFAVSAARADGTRIGVVSSERMYVPGGIARWLAARAQLDADKPKFKVVESPDGKKPAPPAFCENPSDRMKKLCKDIADHEHARLTSSEWQKHEREVLDPIEADVRKALEQFAKARGLDLLLDRDEVGGLLYAAPSLDVTDAFLKDYNARTKRR